MVGLNLMLAQSALAGPSFLTDDPEPTDYQHWESYLFATGDHEGGAYTINGPAMELDYGLLPDTQMSLSVPMTTVGGGGEPTVSGVGDVQLSLKYRFLHETNGWPQISFYPAITLPTGEHGFNCRCGFKRVVGRGRLTAAAARR
jgi:hypothetical protein